MKEFYEWFRGAFIHFGMMPIKHVPAIDLIHTGKGGNEGKFYQIFFNHDSNLVLYVHDPVTLKTATYIFEGFITREELTSVYVKTEEEIQEILKKSKNDSINDAKFINEKERLLKQIEDNQTPPKFTFEDLVERYGDKIDVSKTDIPINMDSNVIPRGSSVLFNKDRNGCLIYQKNGKFFILGAREKPFSVEPEKEGTWTFFIKDVALMNHICAATKSRVVFAESTQYIEIFNKENAGKNTFSVFAENDADYSHIKGLRVLRLPVGFLSWAQYFEQIATIEDARENLRHLISGSKSK